MLRGAAGSRGVTAEVSAAGRSSLVLRLILLCTLLFGFFVGLVWFGDISARYELRERGLWAEAAVS